MQVALRVGREPLPKVFDQLAVEIPDFGRWHGRLENQKRSSTKIDRCCYERFLHGEDHMPISADSLFGAKRRRVRLPKANTDVFGCMVRVHLQITHCMHVEIDQRMASEQYEHVVEEAHTGIDLVLSATVQIELEFNFCLGCLARDGACSVQDNSIPSG
jgi:hypothetical protein